MCNCRSHKRGVFGGQMLLHWNREMLTSPLNWSLFKCTNVCSVKDSRKGGSRLGHIQRAAGPQLSVNTVFLQSRGYLLFTSSRNCSAALLISLICRDNFKMLFHDFFHSELDSSLLSVGSPEKSRRAVHFHIRQLLSMLTLDNIALNISNI